MAKKNIYSGELNKHDKWGGPLIKDGVIYDAADGESVENFIKGGLDSKWGFIHDNGKGKYYIFADEESCNIYLEHEDDDPMDPEIAALKLAEMNSYSNYRIVITLDSEHTQPTNAILVGQTGNEVVFKVETFDKDDNPLIEVININYSITRPDGSKTFVTHVAQAGETDRLTVDNYLTEGQNIVAINAVGGTSNAIANTTVIYQVINLRVVDNINIARVHDVSDGKSSTLTIVWGVTGTSTVNKFIEWYVDGILQDAPDPIPGGQESGNLTKTIGINSRDFSEGRHNIQYRAWLVINEKRFYTPTYYRDFIVSNGGETPIVAAALEIPIGYDPFTGETYLTPVLYDVVQYTSFNLPVAVYKPNVANVNTTVQVCYTDGDIEKVDVSYTNSVEEGQIWDATVSPTVSGETRIKIIANDGVESTVYIIGAPIEKNELNVYEITAGLILNLRANGKTNNPEDREIWEYDNGSEVYSTTFYNFTWDDTSGWNNDELIISNNNAIEVNCKPLTSTIQDDGLTFEIEFSTFNVSNDDAVICNIKNDGVNMPGITLTASEAIFNDNALNSVSTKFKSGENNRIVFVVDPESAGKPLIYIYVNGAACGAAGYNRTTSSFAADKYIRIEGSAEAGVKIRQIRIYNRALDADDILNNYMLYRNTFQEMKEIYDRNDVYAVRGKFDMDAISSILPMLLITDYDQTRNNIENLMSFTTVDKSTPILLRRIQYINNLDPITNFLVEYPQMTCQGTSSMNYPKKNLRLYIKDKAKGKYGEWPLPITYTGTTSTIDKISPEGQEINPSKPGKGKVAFKSGLEGTFSEGERKAQAVNCWTFKADFAESSSSHNTGVARFWNQVMRDATLEGKFVSRTRAQAVVMSDPTNNMDVRTTVDGFPCVVFYRYSMDDTDWKFLGKYNFNNDKSTESVYGFCDIDGIDYQEYEYEQIDQATYEAGKAEHPDDWSSTTKNYATVEALEAAVRDKVGKKAPEPLTEMDYILTLCPTAYEYSKTYQEGKATIAEEPYLALYAQKIMTAGDVKNKNYCVEVLENENRVTNFIADVSEFDSDWDKGFEFRYPEVDKDIPDADTKGGLTNLREFYAWCHSTMETSDAFTPGMTISICGETRHNEDLVYKQAEQYYAANGNYVVNTYEDFLNYQKLKFEKEKWDYLDIFKMAAYYVYLMRFGAVDQVVKNSMFTSEGTVSYIAITTASGSDTGGTKTVTVKYEETIGNHCKWFYINYDNDTILGLNNDGQLVYKPDIDRNSRTGSGSWIEYAEPTTAQTAACIGEYDTYDDLIHAQKTGEIHPNSGDMYKVGDEVYEWSNESGYAYAGHSSVLWNNLEADGEFMTIVSDIDNALYVAGLTYDNALTMFNTKQANMWCERILNKDANFKYIESYTIQGLNHLGKMQGPRSSHRAWWLSKRFTYFDSKFVSGDYKNKKVLFKADAPIERGDDPLKFTLLPTEFMNYGWGITNRSNGQTGIPSTKKPDGTFNYLTFDVKDGGMAALAQGDPVEIYATPYISELDLSNFAPYLMVLDLSGVQHDVLGSQLKKLILGKPGKVNRGTSSLKPSDLTGIEKAEKLEYIDMQGFENLTSLDLSQNPNVKEVYAFRSGLLAIVFANGSRMEKLSLPACYNTLLLNGVNYLAANKIAFENDDMSKVNNLQIVNCDALKETSIDILKKWYGQKDDALANTIVRFEGFDWVITYDDLDMFEALKNNCDSFNLRGTITISDNIQGDTREETVQRVQRIKDLFGVNCFDKTKNPPVLVTCRLPFVIIDSDKTVVTARQDTVVNYSCEIYPNREPNSYVVFEIVRGEEYDTRTGVTIESDSENATAVLTTEELITGEDNNLTIRVTYWWEGSNQFTSEINLLVKDPTYPMSSTGLTISGASSIKKENRYFYDLEVLGPDEKDATGTYTVEWTFDNMSSPYIDYDNCGVVPGNQNRYVVATSTQEPETSANIHLIANVVPVNGSPVSKSFKLLILNEDVIISIESNPVVMNVASAAGWASDPNVLTKSEALDVTDIGTVFANLVSDAFTFDEFAEFVNVKTIQENAFMNCNVTKLTLPKDIETIGQGAFQGCDGLTEIDFGQNTKLTTIPRFCFYQCQSLSKVILPASITKIEQYAFGGTRNIQHLAVSGTEISKNVVVVPNTLTTIVDGAFETFSSTDTGNVINIDCGLVSVEIPAKLGLISDGKLDKYMLRGENITAFTVNDKSTTYVAVDGVLYNKTQQTIYKYPCGKSDLTTYTTLDNCITLYDYSFYNTQLEHITLNRIITQFGQHVFAFNNNLLDIDMSLSTSLKVIGNYAYQNCVALTAITYPTSLEEFGNHIYERCDAMTDIVIPNTVKTVGNYFIVECNNIESLELPDSITTVKRVIDPRNPDCFMKSCHNLKYIKFPKYLTLEYNSADDMTSLTAVTLPVASYNIEEGGEIHSVVVNATSFSNRHILGGKTADAGKLLEYRIPEEDSGEIFETYEGSIYSVPDKQIVNVPFGISVLNMKPGTISVKGGDNMTNGGGAVAKCVHMTEVNFSDTLTTIGEYGFTQCTSLRSITLPESFTTTAGRCFADCTSLSSATFEKNYKNIGSELFNGDRNLRSVVFKSNLSGGSLGYAAFNNCSKLSALTMAFMSVPTIPNGGNVSRGYNPFGTLDADLDFTGSAPLSRIPSSFIGYETRKDGVNTLKVAYFTNPEGTKTSLELYREANRWGDPLFTPATDQVLRGTCTYEELIKKTWGKIDNPTQEEIDACIGAYDTFKNLVKAVTDGEINPAIGDMYKVGEGDKTIVYVWGERLSLDDVWRVSDRDNNYYGWDGEQWQSLGRIFNGSEFNIEYLTFADDIYIKLYSGGSEYNYDGTDTTQIPYADEINMGIYQTSGEFAGYYKFSFGGDVISNKPITITKGAAGDMFGTIRPLAFEEHVYELSANLMGITRFKATSPSEEPTVSKYDYDVLVSKFNSLDTKVRKLLGK